MSNIVDPNLVRMAQQVGHAPQIVLDPNVAGAIGGLQDKIVFALVEKEWDRDDLDKDDTYEVVARRVLDRLVKFNTIAQAWSEEQRAKHE
jgi:hypothetical protein